MKRKLFFILSLFLIYSTYIFGENFPQKAKTVNDFIPKGWKILKGQPANISKEINLASKRKENKLSLEDEVELKREILNSLYEN